ncbi:hypothetical protein [Streptomyces sp. CA2R106]|uniref:hypothetical protein n=1 Tax=Streptomyces sp. CA2R106 TaxID=3120153 RepID=UPI00300AB556
MFGRTREDSTDDWDRTDRLLVGLRGSRLPKHGDQFTEIVRDGLLSSPDLDQYPPAGHDYPQRG